MPTASQKSRRSSRGPAAIGGGGAGGRTPRPVKGPRWGELLLIGLLLAWGQWWRTLTGLLVVVVGGLIAAVLIAGGISVLLDRPSRPRAFKPTADLLADVVARARAHGGVYLGLDNRGAWRYSRPQRAVLLVGPPRSGKTSAVIIPTVIAHPGPVVSTSTKPDVLAATQNTRGRLGRVWQFDPTASTGVEGCEVLRWSPVTLAAVWDGALLVARAMVSASSVGAGTSDRSHWTSRAQALLAPLLHAAVLSGRDIASVLYWVMGHELDQPGALLQRHQGSPRAVSLLTGVQNTEGRERSSIFSAAADALDAYSADAALAAARHPNFDAWRFVHSTDTIYIHAPADQQALAAPLVCGLLAEIRRAVYHAYRQGTLPAPVLWALDEVANIAPLADLPQIASEGGGQDLVLLAAVQDLSQARHRWGAAADGFLTLFGAKLILPGVTDARTLETISLALGEYDRTMVSTTRSRNPHSILIPQVSRTYSTQRQRVLTPGQIANLPADQALYLDGVVWQRLRLTPAHRHQPWASLTQPAPAA